MFEKMKKSKLWRKIRSTKVNRAAVLTVFVLVAALAVIISVTVASNRSKKKGGDLPPVDSQSSSEDTTPITQAPVKNPETQTPETTPSDTGAAKVEDKMPSFKLPVSGKLLSSHDPTIQVMSKTMGDYRAHVGIDIMTAENAPVYAAADGKVQKIWEDPKMGYCIALTHGGESCTIYKNLAKDLPSGISEGASVRSGQLIATVGNSAMVEIAEEPHLHFEMTVSDLSVDPLKYFDENSVASLNNDSNFEG